MVSTLVDVRSGIDDFFTLNSFGGDFFGVNENFFTNAAVRPLFRSDFGVGNIGKELLVDGISSDDFFGDASSSKCSLIFLDFFFKCSNVNTLVKRFFLLLIDGDFATNNGSFATDRVSSPDSIVACSLVEAVVDVTAANWSGAKLVMMETGFGLQLLSVLLLFTKSITVSSDEKDART